MCSVVPSHAHIAQKPNYTQSFEVNISAIFCIILCTIGKLSGRAGGEGRATFAEEDPRSFFPLLEILQLCSAL